MAEPYWAGTYHGRVAHLVIREEHDWPRSQVACGLVVQIDRGVGMTTSPHCKRCQEWALGYGLKEASA